MDVTGFYVLIVGAWAITAPIVITLAVKARRYWLANCYPLPMLWFLVGYPIAALG